jgi:hypothetical protein
MVFNSLNQRRAGHQILTVLAGTVLSLLIVAVGSAAAQNSGGRECRAECKDQKSECRSGCRDLFKDCIGPAVAAARDCRSTCNLELGEDTEEAGLCIDECKSEILAPVREECSAARKDCRTVCHPGNCVRTCRPGASGPSACIRECVGTAAECAKEGRPELRSCRRECRGLEAEAGETCRATCGVQVEESHEACRTVFGECASVCSDTDDGNTDAP